MSLEIQTAHRQATFVRLLDKRLCIGKLSRRSLHNTSAEAFGIPTGTHRMFQVIESHMCSMSVDGDDDATGLL